ncbi:MAG TPA: hypothetical protein VI461_01140 [Chitinophagaceae bacterium]|nr:hypothetical protein [Chitinophagaceae bacterium]
MFSYSTRVEKVSEVWSDSFKVYKEHFTKIVGLVFVANLISAVLQYFMPIDETSKGFATYGSGPLPVVLTLITLLIAVYFLAAIFHRYQGLVLGQNPSFTVSLQFALKRYFVYLGAMIIATILMGVGFIILVIPGIFLAFLLAFTMPSVILDDKNVFSSIDYSSKLVWGNWWRNFVVLFIPGLILAVVNIALALLFTPNHMVVFLILNLILMSIAAPWIYAVLLVQYNDLKLRYAEKMAKK